MAELLKPLRVHIVPVGFEKDRIIKPIIELKADKVYLIGYKEKGAGLPFVEYAEKKLIEKGIKVKVENCNRNDLFDLIKCFKDIIDIEKGNNIYINVSSGGTFPSIAGTMSSMLFRERNVSIEPYYVTPEKYENEPKPNKYLKPESYGVKEIVSIPNYKVYLPPKHLIKVIKFIERFSEGVSKKELIRYVFDEGIATSQKYEKKSKNQKISPVEKQKEASNKHMWVNHNIIEKLNDWKLIEVDGKRKSMLITLNKQGKDMVKFL